jgi:predicted RNase H-like HicB family nuclease
MQMIRVIHHQEPQGWWAESPDIPEWSAAGESFVEVRRLAEEGVRFALGDRDLFVEHFVPETPAPQAARG